MRINKAHVAIAFAITAPLGVAAYVAYRRAQENDDGQPSGTGVIGEAVAMVRGLFSSSEPTVANSLPANHPALAYADDIDVCAHKYDLDAMMVVVIGDRESKWGTTEFLVPHGPGGAGDRGARHRVKEPDSRLLPYWDKLTGMLSPPTWANGARGFGLGLMQIDAEFNTSWAFGTDWTNPRENIQKGCSILKACFDAFPSNTEAAFCAYNAGIRKVQKAIDAGNSPSSVTTGGDYGEWAISRLAAYGVAA